MNCKKNETGTADNLFFSVGKYRTLEDKKMREIQYEIIKEIAVLSKSGSGYTKEINLIAWNGNEPKYDVRSFSPNREKCSKGVR